MNAAIQLLAKIFRMKFPWNCWVSVLAGVNMIGGIYYWSLLEGKVVLACLIGSFIVMTAIFTKLGFVRLLGLGHILFWTPLVIWILQRLREETFATDPHLQTWIYSVLVINSLSLVIDYLDVIRFLRGEKAEV